MRPARRPSRPEAAVTPGARPTAAAAQEAAVVEELDSPAAEDASASRRRDRARTDTTSPARSRSAQPSGLLAARAAQEYGYVARDVRHIGVVGGGLFATLLVVFVLIEVLHLFSI
jgi:hypothetical protein